MKELPILMSAPMVRAILAGTKTQTRRVIKPAPQMVTDKAIKPWHGDASTLLRLLEQTGKACPYGQPGDRLWVRETWSTHACFDHLPPNECPKSIHYWADGKVQTGKGRPSIHMPRWASRITLEISGVHVERLQAISEADAQAEGCAYSERFRGYCVGEAEHFNSHDPRQSFFSLWAAINGAGSVDANPWVWVVAFKRVAS